MIPRRSTALALALLASGAAHAWPESRAPWVFDLPKGGSNCTLLDTATYPIRYDVGFSADIQPQLNTLCASCHISGSTSGFNVNASNARLSLLGPAETGTPFTANPAIFRVRPGRPQESGLFLKLNCQTPPTPYGSQMPPGGASAELQALVHDWIAAGALMPEYGGDRTFIGSFESIVRPVPAP